MSNHLSHHHSLGVIIATFILFNATYASNSKDSTINLWLEKATTAELVNKAYEFESNQEIDSAVFCFKQVVSNNKDSTSNLPYLIKLAELNKEMAEFNDAIKCYEEANIILKTKSSYDTLANHLEIAYCYYKLENSGAYLNKINSLDRIVRKKNDSANLARVNIALAEAYLKESQSKSISYYLSALEYYNKHPNLHYEIRIYNGIAIIYFYLKRYEDAVAYLKKGLKRVLEEDSENNTNTNTDYFRLCTNLGAIYLQLGMIDSADRYHTMSQSKIEQLTNKHLKVESLIVYGEYLLKTNRLDQALKTITFAETLMNENLKKRLGPALTVKAAIYFKKNQLIDAEKQLLKAIEITKSYPDGTLILAQYRTLITIYKKLGDFQKALLYEKVRSKTQDSILALELSDKIITKVEQFEDQKRENKILQLNNQIESIAIKNQNRIRLLTVSGSIIVILILFIFFRVYGNKKSLIHEKLMLEKDKRIWDKKLNETQLNKKVALLDAVLNGEDKERKRVAQDLHDEVGALLTTMKLNISMLEEDIIKNDKSSKKYFHSLSKLESEIDYLYKDTKSLSKKLMPITLNYGLKDAFENLIFSLMQTEVVTIEFQDINLKDQKINRELKVNVYYILEELLRNVIQKKISKNIFFQISCFKNLLTLEFELTDYLEEIKDHDFIKFASIENTMDRIKFINGTYQFNASKVDGFSLVVNFLM